LSVLKIPTAKIFEPLLLPARYKGVYGGRGSGKSHFFGELLVETCEAERGTSAVCIREAQSTLAQSSKRLIENKIAGLGLGHRFKIYNDKIETPGDGIIIFRGMQVRAIATILNSFGIEEEDRRELRADFQHLRRWRKSVEQAQSFTFKAVITIIVGGVLGAVWLGIKAMLGK
jgi:phage terminase large subunit